MSKSWGQQVIVDNRPGGGGNIGADIVAKAPPDGYTLVNGTIGTHAINATLFSKLPYDPIRDFVPSPSSSKPKACSPSIRRCR